MKLDFDRHVALKGFEVDSSAIVGRKSVNGDEDNKSLGV